MNESIDVLIEKCREIVLERGVPGGSFYLFSQIRTPEIGTPRDCHVYENGTIRIVTSDVTDSIIVYKRPNNKSRYAIPVIKLDTFGDLALLPEVQSIRQYIASF